jgi:hypothetical protein
MLVVNVLLCLEYERNTSCFKVSLRFSKRVAGRQTQYANKREGRSGSLREGHLKSSISQLQIPLPAGCRYLEGILNPLCAAMASAS